MRASIRTQTYGPLRGFPILRIEVSSQEPEDLSPIIPGLYHRYKTLIQFSPGPIHPDLLTHYRNLIGVPYLAEIETDRYLVNNEVLLVHRLPAREWKGIPFVHLLLTIDCEEDIEAAIKVVPSINDQCITFDVLDPKLRARALTRIPPNCMLRFQNAFVQNLYPQDQETKPQEETNENTANNPVSEPSRVRARRSARN
jgi:hypothetical protein